MESKAKELAGVLAQQMDNDQPDRAVGLALAIVDVKRLQFAAHESRQALTELGINIPQWLGEL